MCQRLLLALFLYDLNNEGFFIYNAVVILCVLSCYSLTEICEAKEQEVNGKAGSVSKSSYATPRNIFGCINLSVTE